VRCCSWVEHPILMLLLSRLWFRHFVKKHKDSEPTVEFQCSPGFNSDFKRTCRFSPRGAHLKHRPTRGIDDSDYCIWTLVQLLQEIPNHEPITNIDESCWRMCPARSCHSPLFRLENRTLLKSLTLAMSDTVDSIIPGPGRRPLKHFSNGWYD
jgi:hypothetical protein